MVGFSEDTKQTQSERRAVHHVPEIKTPAGDQISGTEHFGIFLISVLCLIFHMLILNRGGLKGLLN